MMHWDDEYHLLTDEEAYEEPEEDETDDLEENVDWLHERWLNRK